MEDHCKENNELVIIEVPTVVPFHTEETQLSLMRVNSPNKILHEIVTRTIGEVMDIDIFHKEKGRNIDKEEDDVELHMDQMTNDIDSSPRAIKTFRRVDKKTI
ncbi:hypothetical protein HAX54_047267 [Datura stramonium]|uniref:Uncharacterized protein n=1 Tax=Datura stramonium TaxID=4076 RepID=A0ABS8RQJ9_DATST|nr:hypothetical protein [Datura stramonium]